MARQTIFNVWVCSYLKVGWLVGWLVGKEEKATLAGVIPSRVELMSMSR